jgi:hypothetical protein
VSKTWQVEYPITGEFQTKLNPRKKNQKFQEMKFFFSWKPGCQGDMQREKQISTTQRKVETKEESTRQHKRRLKQERGENHSSTQKVEARLGRKTLDNKKEGRGKRGESTNRQKKTRFMKYSSENHSSTQKKVETREGRKPLVNTKEG